MLSLSKKHLLLMPCYILTFKMQQAFLMCVQSHFSRVWLYDPMDCSWPGSFLHGILQARILEWVSMPSSKGPSWPRVRTCISFVSCIGRQVLYHWAPPAKPILLIMTTISSVGQQTYKPTSYIHLAGNTLGPRCLPHWGRAGQYRGPLTSNFWPLCSPLAGVGGIYRIQWDHMVKCIHISTNHACLCLLPSKAIYSTWISKLLCKLMIQFT